LTKSRGGLGGCIGADMTQTKYDMIA